MNSYLYTWNPKKWNWSDLQYAIHRVNNDKHYDMYWSCGQTKKIALGDIFFLIRLGAEPKGIVGCGYIRSRPVELSHWDEDKAAKGMMSLHTSLLFKSLSEEPILSLDILQDRHPEYKWTPQISGLNVPDDIALDLQELILSDHRYKFQENPLNKAFDYVEGKEKTVTYKTYDRSSAARQACIEYYGYNCSVCGFSFEKAFGDLGQNYIEVHHLKQIADMGGEYLIDPIEDLRPVCANCHCMLHKKRPALSIEELKLHNKHSISV